MKILSILILSAGLAWADPSENGLEHRDKPWHHNNPNFPGEALPVPDNGSTLLLLGIGLFGLIAWSATLVKA